LTAKDAKDAKDAKELLDEPRRSRRALGGVRHSVKYAGFLNNCLGTPELPEAVNQESRVVRSANCLVAFLRVLRVLRVLRGQLHVCGRKGP
jgi:hypothetical protein